MANISHAISNALAKELGELSKRTARKAAQDHRTTVDGTVTRIDGSIVWVTIDNGEMVPTAAQTASVSVGDRVSVTIGGGKARIVGNMTAPSVGSGFVDKQVSRAAKSVKAIATAAGDLAQDAKRIATATNQYFWHDSNGAHISTEEGNPTGAQNAIWNSLGMLFRAGATNLLAIVAGSNSGIDVYDGDGNTTDNIVASLRKNALKLWSRAQGYTAQLVLTATSLTMYLDDSPGSAKTVMKLATSGSKIGSALTVDDPKDSVGNDLKLGDPDTVTSSFDATNVANTTNKSLGHVTLGAGVWMVVALVAFPANATGIRRIGLSDTNDGMPSTGPVIQMNASTAGPTRVFLTWFIDNGTAPSGAPFITTPLYLTAYQTSGSTLSCTGHIRAVHIS